MTLTSQNVVAWHDRNAGQHKTLLDEWAAKGFRTLSLAIYGAPQDPRYAAVVVKRPVVIATKQFGPVNQAGIQQAFNDMAKQGWGPYILTATGPPSAAVFAGVFTPMSGIPLTRLNLTGQQLSEERITNSMRRAIFYCGPRFRHVGGHALHGDLGSES